MKGIQEFTKRLAEDKEFADSIAKTAPKEELMAKMKEAGYDITEEERNRMAETEGELADDELEKIAGGSGCSCKKTGDTYRIKVFIRGSSKARPFVIYELQKRGIPVDFVPSEYELTCKERYDWHSASYVSEYEFDAEGRLLQIF